MRYKTKIKSYYLKLRLIISREHLVESLHDFFRWDPGLINNKYHQDLKDVPHEEFLAE